MMSFLVTVALAGTAPAQGYGGYSGYGGYGGYGGNAWGTYYPGCCPPGILFTPALAPVPGQPSAPADIDQQLDQKLREMKEILEKLNKRLKDMEKKQKKFKAQVDGTEDRIQTLADMHVDLARTIGNRLADLKIMSRTLELKIAEESLRQKTEALAEKTRAAEAAEKQRREMARLEADLQKIQKKPAHDALARTLIRDLEQQIAAMDAIMKTKLAAVPDQFGGLAKKAQEERMRQHFSRLDQRMQQIEDHFLQGQKMAEKPAIPVNRALVIVNLPVGAKLFVNDQFTKGEGSPRFFLTPELKIGTTYSYTLRMETFLNGTMVSSSQKIYFRAGKEAHAVFETTGGNVSEVRPAILP